MFANLILTMEDHFPDRSIREHFPPEFCFFLCPSTPRLISMAPRDFLSPTAVLSELEVCVAI